MEKGNSFRWIALFYLLTVLFVVFTLLRAIMKKILLTLLTSLLTLTTFAEKDAFVGFYKGEVISEKYWYPLSGDNTVYAEVYRNAKGYHVKFVPSIFTGCEIYGKAENLKAENGKIVLENVGEGEKLSDFKGVITPDEINVKAKHRGDAELKLKRYVYVSPTMGMKPSAGATVIFDGSSLDNFIGVARGQEVALPWILNKDGTMTSAKGNSKYYVSAETKQKFEKFRLHMEFKFPCVYNQTRVTSSNGGVYFARVYEIQLMENFGSVGHWDETGAIYRQMRPMVNASLEAGAWQTFDMEFTPAIYEGSTLVSLPKVTIWHNGVLIHKDAVIKYPTHLQPAEGAKFDQQKHARIGGIMLQDHGAPITYRNIFVY